jgi:hypothetical protein
MSDPLVPNVVIQAAIHPAGLAHVSVFLARAFGKHAALELEPRADLLKCPGGQLACCASCSRGLAPAAQEHQRWIEPAMGPICGYYADVDKVQSLYGPMSDHIKAVLAENHVLKGRVPA